MLTKLKANILFHRLLKRPDINKAYAMVGPEDSWYATITKVHQSLAEIQALPHEHLSITSHDGLKLKGIYYPADSAEAVTVICVHGYTSHAEREWAFPGLFYHSLGYNVLIPYQRAHGPSEGKYITFGALEHRDMMDWVQLINRRSPDHRIILHGLSMGGGIVLNLADKELPNVKCLIADAPNTGIESLFRNIAGAVFKKDADKVCRQLFRKFQRLFHADVADFDGFKQVAQSKYPLFLTAGSEENLDGLLTQLKELCPKETEILILPGCNHGNGMYKQTALFQNALKEYILKNL